MITLHICQLLEDAGFGTLALTGSETGDLLFFEKLPTGAAGIYVMSRGSSLGRGLRTTQSFDIYERGYNDIDGATRLKNILNFFTQECYPICDLPIVPGYSEAQYKNCVIVPTSSIDNVGLDETDRVIYVVSATVTYQEEINNG